MTQGKVQDSRSFLKAWDAGLHLSASASPRGRVYPGPLTAPPSCRSRLARETGPRSKPTATPLLSRAGLRGPRARARGCPRVGSAPIGPRRPRDPAGRASRARSGAAPARAGGSCTRTRAPSPPPVEPAPGPPGQSPRARPGGGARGAGARRGARAEGGPLPGGPGPQRPAASAARVRARRLPRAALSPGWGGGPARGAARCFPSVAGGGRRAGRLGPCSRSRGRKTLIQSPCAPSSAEDRVPPPNPLSVCSSAQFGGTWSLAPVPATNPTGLPGPAVGAQVELQVLGTRASPGSQTAWALVAWQRFICPISTPA